MNLCKLLDDELSRLLNDIEFSTNESKNQPNDSILSEDLRHFNEYLLANLQTFSQNLCDSLSNLINNAFSYGKGEVIVRTEITAKFIILSVMDNGPGIPLSQMARLLRPFERLDSARTNASGSGLGLAIADRIAKLHQGKLELINRPQGGLEVRLSLPMDVNLNA